MFHTLAPPHCHHSLVGSVVWWCCSNLAKWCDVVLWQNHSIILSLFLINLWLYSQRISEGFFLQMYDFSISQNIQDFSSKFTSLTSEILSFFLRRFLPCCSFFFFQYSGLNALLEIAALKRAKKKKNLQLLDIWRNPSLQNKNDNVTAQSPTMCLQHASCPDFLFHSSFFRTGYFPTSHGLTFPCVCSFLLTCGFVCLFDWLALYCMFTFVLYFL